MKFSIIVNTISRFIRENCIICINTSSFLYSFSAFLILFRYSVELIFEIRFFNLTIIRLINHTFDFELFAKFFFSCIFTLFVVFRNTTCVYKFDDDAFFSFFLFLLSVYNLKDYNIVSNLQRTQFTNVFIQSLYFVAFNVSVTFSRYILRMVLLSNLQVLYINDSNRPPNE